MHSPSSSALSIHPYEFCFGREVSSPSSQSECSRETSKSKLFRIACEDGLSVNSQLSDFLHRVKQGLLRSHCSKDILSICLHLIRDIGDNEIMIQHCKIAKGNALFTKLSNFEKEVVPSLFTGPRFDWIPITPSRPTLSTNPQLRESFDYFFLSFCTLCKRIFLDLRAAVGHHCVLVARSTQHDHQMIFVLVNINELAPPHAMEMDQRQWMIEKTKHFLLGQPLPVTEAWPWTPLNTQDMLKMSPKFGSFNTTIMTEGSSDEETQTMDDPGSFISRQRYHRRRHHLFFRSGIDLNALPSSDATNLDKPLVAANPGFAILSCELGSEYFSVVDRTGVPPSDPIVAVCFPYDSRHPFIMKDSELLTIHLQTIDFKRLDSLKVSIRVQNLSGYVWCLPVGANGNRRMKCSPVQRYPMPIPSDFQFRLNPLEESHCLSIPVMIEDPDLNFQVLFVTVQCSICSEYQSLNQSAPTSPPCNILVTRTFTITRAEFIPPAHHE
jgi:hypothetical protein